MKPHSKECRECEVRFQQRYHVLQQRYDALLEQITRCKMLQPLPPMIIENPSAVVEHLAAEASEVLKAKDVNICKEKPNE